MNAAAGGAGGFGGDGSLTAEFPSGREPERGPEMGQDFENASFTDTQAAQDQERLDALENQRDAPEVQGMNYTIGGDDEQAVHENVSDEREMEIRELQERIERQRGRSRGRS